MQIYNHRMLQYPKLFYLERLGMLPQMSRHWRHVGRLVAASTFSNLEDVVIPQLNAFGTTESGNPRIRYLLSYLRYQLNKKSFSDSEGLCNCNAISLASQISVRSHLIFFELLKTGFLLIWVVTLIFFKEIWKLAWQFYQILSVFHAKLPHNRLKIAIFRTFTPS